MNKNQEKINALKNVVSLIDDDIKLLRRGLNGIYGTYNESMKGHGMMMNKIKELEEKREEIISDITKLENLK